MVAASYEQTVESVKDISKTLIRRKKRAAVLGGNAGSSGVEATIKMLRTLAMFYNAPGKIALCCQRLRREKVCSFSCRKGA